ncbi:MAG: M23 family metallopeptidase [Patescibacteria group bacterium]|nr:M23 family metallopeptidase [Patescibacteria group bacterium]
MNKKILFLLSFFVTIIFFALSVKTLYAQDVQCPTEGNTSTCTTQVGEGSVESPETNPPELPPNNTNSPLNLPDICSTISQGPYQGPSHQNLLAWDFAVPRGTPVYSTFAGTVTRTGQYQGTCKWSKNDNYDKWCSPTEKYGIWIEIQRSDGVFARYAHFTPESIAKIQSLSKVSEGEFIGWVDSTGLSTGNHLHYQLSDISVVPDAIKACQ